MEEKTMEENELFYYFSEDFPNLKHHVTDYCKIENNILKVFLDDGRIIQYIKKLDAIPQKDYLNSIGLI